MMQRRAARAALLLCLALPAAAGAVTLRYASQDDPQTVDPHAANLLASSRLTQQVFDTLVWRDRGWKVIPWLAVSWQQVNDKLWRFKLRPDVKFHDGAVMTADDVVFSVQRALDPLSQQRVSLQGVESARKVDDLTVELVLKEVNPVLLQHLTQFRIMNKAWAVKHRSERPQDYKNREDTYGSRHANGTGPFKLTVREPDVKTVLVAHKDWWGRKTGAFESNIDEVVMLPIKSAGTRMAALLSGEVDFVLDPPVQDVQRLATNPSLKVVEGTELRVQYLAFDMNRDKLLYGNAKDGKNPFKDARVRKAVAHAVDAEAIKRVVMRGNAKPTGSMVTPLVEGYHPDGDKRLPLDRDLARKLMTEAGYAQGFDVTLDCGSNQPASDICQAVASMLAQIGIRVKPNIVPLANFFPKLEKLDTSFYLLSWGGGVTSDAFYTLQMLYATHAGNGQGDFNMGRYSSPEMDKLIASIKVESNAARRLETIRQAMVLINRDMPTIAIHQPVIPWVMKKNVSAWFSPVNTAFFYRMKVD